MELATFGAGCFWKPEAIYSETKGVRNTAVGYMGGDRPFATYEEVCSGKTGHAEVVQLEFDSKLIKYEDLLKIFWDLHNPTTLNQDGPNLGTQYRSVILYHSSEQKLAAEKSKQEAQKKYKAQIVTEILPAGEFYRAEEYHQKYFKKTGKVCSI
jgi:peptide-methionine (S)-S-oxide reductase